MLKKTELKPVSEAGIRTHTLIIQIRAFKFFAILLSKIYFVFSDFKASIKRQIIFVKFVKTSYSYNRKLLTPTIEKSVFYLEKIKKFSAFSSINTAYNIPEKNCGY